MNQFESHKHINHLV